MQGLVIALTGNVPKPDLRTEVAQERDNLVILLAPLFVTVAARMVRLVDMKFDDLNQGNH